MQALPSVEFQLPQPLRHPFLYVPAAAASQLFGPDRLPPASVTFVGPALAELGPLTLKNTAATQPRNLRNMMLTGHSALRSALQVSCWTDRMYA